MASDYLVHKWKLWFRSLDVMKVGHITREGVSEEKKRFALHHRLEGDKTTEIIDKLDKWWDEFIFRGNPGPISEQEFIEMQSNDFKANKENYSKWVESCSRTICDALYFEEPGMISEEEFLIAFKSGGHENIKLDKEFFNAYDPVDGKVSVQKMVDSWVTFLTNEDSSKPDIVKKALEDGV